MRYSPKEVRHHFIRTYRLANTLIYGIVACYIPINTLMRRGDTIPVIPMAAAFTLMLLLSLASFITPRLKLSQENIALTLTALFGLGFNAICFLIYPTNPMIFALIMFCLIPAIFIEPNWVFVAYTALTTGNALFCLYLKSTSIFTGTSRIPLNHLSAPVRLTMALLVLCSLILVVLLRRALLSHVLDNLFESLRAAENREMSCQLINQDLDALVKDRTEALESTMQQLYQSERLASLGALVAGVSHEINTPLGVSVSANSYVQMINERAIASMRSGQFGKSDLIEYMRNVDEATEILSTNLSRAAELITNFKALAVTQSSDILTDFNLHDDVQSVILSLKHEYKNYDVTFDNSIPKDLILVSYPGFFAQITTNFLMNALIHARTEDKPLIISISAFQRDHQLTLSFSDNGRGIPEAILPQIFDPFFTTKRHEGGSGLGLNIIYNIVTARLKGQITCQSKVGEGTIFTLQLPQVRTTERTDDSHEQMG